MRGLAMVLGGLAITASACGSDPGGPSGPPLVILTNRLENAVEGRAYSQTLEASGGDGGYAWSVEAGALPDGLALAPETGVISGVPTSRLGTTVTLGVASGGKDAAATLELVVDAVLGPKEFCTDFTPGSIATFEDAVLGAAVVEAVGDTVQETTCAQLGQLGVLRLDSGLVASLWGAQNLTDVWRFFVPGGTVDDLTPLSTLRNLTHLRVNAHAVSDLSPLAEVPAQLLFLAGNSITDISPLENMTYLTNVTLAANVNLGDIQPLLDNSGIGPPDEVNLSGTSVSCSDIAALEAKGVTVSSDCP